MAEVGKYTIIEAKNPDMVQLSKAELQAKGTKAAKDELKRREANRAAKRAARLKKGKK